MIQMGVTKLSFLYQLTLEKILSLSQELHRAEKYQG